MYFGKIKPQPVFKFIFGWFYSVNLFFFKEFNSLSKKSSLSCWIFSNEFIFTSIPSILFRFSSFSSFKLLIYFWSSLIYFWYLSSFESVSIISYENFFSFSIIFILIYFIVLSKVIFFVSSKSNSYFSFFIWASLVFSTSIRFSPDSFGLSSFSDSFGGTANLFNFGNNVKIFNVCFVRDNVLSIDVYRVSGWRSWKRLDMSITLLADRILPVRNCQKPLANCQL